MGGDYAPLETTLGAIQALHELPSDVKLVLIGDKNAILAIVRKEGVSPDAFDGRGNYTLGLRDQLIFPEIEYDKIDKLRGMEVTIVTTAKSDDHARLMLQLLGMPFKKEA